MNYLVGCIKNKQGNYPKEQEQGERGSECQGVPPCEDAIEGSGGCAMCHLGRGTFHAEGIATTMAWRWEFA